MERIDRKTTSANPKRTEESYPGTNSARFNPSSPTTTQTRPESSSNTGSSSSNESKQRNSSPPATKVDTENRPRLSRKQGLTGSNRSNRSKSSENSSTRSMGGKNASSELPPPRPPKYDDEDDSNNPYTAGRIPLTNRMVDRFQSFRYRSGKAVNNKYVQFVLVGLIAINALMMGIATFPFVRNDPKTNDAFELVDQIFLIIFTVELFFQFVYHGWRLILDGWLLFDLVIILTSWSFSSVQIIRAFRIFRALRLITRIKVMKNLVLALFGVMPRMFAIGLLLFLVSYIFAVMFTQLFKELYADGFTDTNYFGRLDDTFFTLFQIMTLDNWADVARQVMAVYTWAWFPFVVFVIVTGFVVVNLIIAVICDAISALHDDEKAKLHGNYAEEEDMGDSEDESVHPGLREDIREQMDTLEAHVEELTRMQEETMLTLQMLAQHVQEQRLLNKRLSQ